MWALWVSRRAFEMRTGESININLGCQNGTSTIKKKDDKNSSEPTNELVRT